MTASVLRLDAPDGITGNELRAAGQDYPADVVQRYTAVPAGATDLALPVPAAGRATSPKSQMGNMEAGNAAECVAAAMAVANDVVPPAINTRNAIDGGRLNVSAAARKQPVNVAVSSVWSIGGQNAALVFRKVG